MMAQPPRFTRPEKITVAGLIIFAVIVTSWPWLTAASYRSPGATYLGTNVPDVLDTQVYYAFTQANADGHFVYQNLFTSESHPAVLFNPLWLVLGLFVRLTNWSPVTIFSIAKALIGVIVLFGLYQLLARLFTQAHWRLLGLFLAVFGGGLGWLFIWLLPGQPGLIWAYQNHQIATTFPVDLAYPIGFVWFAMLHSPLFVLSIGLVMAIWWKLHESLTRPQQIRLAGCMVCLLGFIHPYDLLVVFCGIIGVLVVGIMRERINPQLAKTLLRQTLKLALWATPPIVYYAAVLLYVPSLRNWNEQNVLETTNLRTVVAGLTPMIFLAAVGLRAWWRTRPVEAWLLLSWLGTTFVLLYLPFLQYQAKMIIGLSIPLAILATAGVQRLWSFWGPFGRAGLVALILVAVATPFVFVQRVSQSQVVESRYHYLSGDLAAGLNWISQQTPTNAIILGDVWTGNVVPQYARRATYLGHHHQTSDFARKLDQVRAWFFEHSEDGAAKADWLADENITYVIYGPYEREQGSFNPTTVPTLQEVWHRGEVSIYAVIQRLGV